MAWFISLDKCPHGTLAISLDNERGGTRLTHDKCCGLWERQHAWPMSSKAMRSAINELECAAEDAEREEGE